MYGIIVAFGGTEDQLPDGWKPCDGRRLWAGAFPQAAQVMLDLWGPQDPAGFFALPDLTGQFLRGVDSSGRVDPDWDTRENWDKKTGAPWIGTYQGHALASHTHPARFLVTRGGHRTGATSNDGHAGIPPLGDDQTGRNTDAGKNEVKETRPVNAYVIWAVYVGTALTVRANATAPAVTAGRGIVEILPDGTRRTADGTNEEDDLREYPNA